MRHSIKDIQPYMIKILGLLSLTRIYNVALLAVVQCMSCVFFFGQKVGDVSSLGDFRLFLIVLCTWISVASGYIINYFYDKEKDLINHPVKSRLNETVRQSTTLKLYLTMNVLTVIIAAFVSFRTIVFFSGYIFVIWFYCHKLKKMIFVSNLVMAGLGVTPLFAVIFYTRPSDIEMILSHGAFIYLLLLGLSLSNDLKNQYGDAVIGAFTVPLRWGEKQARWIASAVLCLATGAIFWAISTEPTNAFIYYLILASVVAFASAMTLLWSKNPQVYTYIYNGLKILALIGVICMPLRLWSL